MLPPHAVLQGSRKSSQHFSPQLLCDLAQRRAFYGFAVLEQCTLHMLMICHVGHVWCTDHSLVMGAVNRRMDEWVKQENLNLNTVDVGDVDGSDPK